VEMGYVISSTDDTVLSTPKTPFPDPP